MEVKKPGSSCCVVGKVKDLRGWPGRGKSGKRTCPSIEGRLGLKEGEEEDWYRGEAEKSNEEEGWRMGLGERGWGHLARKSVKWAGWVNGGLIVMGQGWEMFVSEESEETRCKGDLPLSTVENREAPK